MEALKKFRLIQNEHDWMKFCQDVCGSVSGEIRRTNFNVKPQQYPSLVAVKPERKMVSDGEEISFACVFVYPADAMILLEACGLKFMDPKIFEPLTVAQNVATPQAPVEQAASVEDLDDRLKGYSSQETMRYLIANLLSVVKLVRDKLGVDERTYLNSFARFLSLVDQQEESRKQEMIRNFNAQALLDTVKRV